MKKLKEIKKIIKNTNVNFLFGAGASKFNVKNPLPLMCDLLGKIVNHSEYRAKKDAFVNSPFKEIIESICANSFEGNDANIEEGISKLEGLLPYCVDENVKNNLYSFINWIKKIIVDIFKTCDVYQSAKLLESFYYNLVKMNNEKISPLRRINIFTTNYDMLNELALENLRIHYYSGFSGFFNKKFNLSLYNYQYSENLGLYNREKLSYISQVNLYKLHGSLSWKINEDDELTETQNYNENESPVIIHPSSSKYYSTNLITYYSALFREFSNEINKEDSSLIVIGSGLNDDHINKVILDAISLPTFTLIILCFCVEGKEEETVRAMEEKFGKRSNVIILASPDNTIEKLSENLFCMEGL